MVTKGHLGNPLDRLDALELAAREAVLHNTTIASMDEATASLGTIAEGSFIAPASTATSIEPTDTGFAGAAMGGNGWTFASTVYNFVAVAAGVLQAGFNTAGKLIAGAGDVTMTGSGIWYFIVVCELKGLGLF